MWPNGFGFRSSLDLAAAGERWESRPPPPCLSSPLCKMGIMPGSRCWRDQRTRCIKVPAHPVTGFSTIAKFCVCRREGKDELSLSYVRNCSPRAKRDVVRRTQKGPCVKSEQDVATHHPCDSGQSTLCHLSRYLARCRPFMADTLSVFRAPLEKPLQGEGSQRRPPAGPSRPLHPAPCLGAFHRGLGR